MLAASVRIIYESMTYDFIVWSIPEEFAADSFKLGWESCFLNAAAADCWFDWINVRTDDFKRDVSDDVCFPS